MKKVLIVSVVLFSLLISGCFNRPTTYEEIDYEIYSDMIKNRESFILFIGSSECNHCVAYKETLKQVIKKYHVDVKYIDISKMNESQKNKFKAHITFAGTPTTIFIKNGKEKSTYNRINGAQDYNKVIAKFADNQYIEVK
ncbi:MAG: thioredoxin family protein [Bacilli bacterium]